MQNSWIKIVVCLICTLGGIQKSYAISGSDQSQKYKFEHLDLPLNNNRVECLIQDRYGFIWIGTLGGLHKYDGVNITVYTASMDSTTLDVDHIESLLEDRHGRLWVGTDEGIYQYDRSSDNFRKFKIEDDYLGDRDYRPQRVESLVEDETGIIWLGSERSGLQHFDESKQEFISFFSEHQSDVLRKASVTSLILHEGFIWVATIYDGLFKVNAHSKEVEQCCQNEEDSRYLKMSRLSTLMLDRNNRLWIGTDGQGLARMNIEEPHHRLKIYKNKKNDETSIFNDAIVNALRGQSWGHMDLQ